MTLNFYKFFRKTLYKRLFLWYTLPCRRLSLSLCRGNMPYRKARFSVQEVFHLPGASVVGFGATKKLFLCKGGTKP